MDTGSVWKIKYVGAIGPMRTALRPGNKEQLIFTVSISA